MLKRLSIGLLLAGVLLLSPADFANAETAAERHQPVTISHFTGKPVPRFEQLTADRVYGRAGPSFDHPVLWEYARTGLPVLIIKESIEWRRVQDPDGDEVWIHHSLLSGGATALLTRDAVLRTSPATDAAPVLRAETGVIASLLACQAGWCRIVLDRTKGWVPETALWGARPPGDPL
ncbi:MAG: SH3 domain-containing protein [Pseudomonadota bacterium]